MSMLPNEETNTPAIKLFQSAHGKLVTLQRINDQLSGILAQRQRVQDELRLIKQQIDDVFERELKQETPGPRTPTEVAQDNIAFRLNAIENAPEPMPIPSRRQTMEKMAT